MAFLFLAATPRVGATVKSLFAEFKRRNVFRVAVLYLVCAWLIAQVADVVVGLGELPPTIGRVVLIILALGFPVSVVLAWVFEWTPQGIRLESEAALEPATERSAGRRLDYVIIALLSVALVYFIATHDWQGSPPIAGASIDAASDRHLWAETYDRELSVENVFAIQSEIAFDTLRDDPRFRSLVNEMDAETARHLEEVRRLEASGEIALPPGA